MEQKTFQVINTANCKYVYLTDERKLVSMEPMETVYDLETGEAFQQFKLGGENGLTQLSINSQFYVSEASFKAGAPIPAANAIDTVALVNIMEKLFPSRYVKEDETGPFLWIYQNGEASKWRLEEHTKKVFIDFCDRKNSRIDGELPKEYYYSADEVYQYNDYAIQDKDGEKVVHEGVYRRLFLTDEQNALVDKVQEDIDACIKAGVTFDFDYADNQLTCFNMKDIKEFGYCPQVDEETEESYPLDLSRAGRCLKHIGDYNTDDSDMAFVIKKSTKK